MRQLFDEPRLILDRKGVLSGLSRKRQYALRANLLRWQCQ